MKVSSSILCLLLSGVTGFMPNYNHNHKLKLKFKQATSSMCSRSSRFEHKSGMDEQRCLHDVTFNAGTRSNTGIRSGTRLNMAMDGAVELTSALATLDRQQNTRSSKRPTGGKPGWTKLILEPDAENTSDEQNQDQEQEQEYPLPQQEEFVYLLEPPSTPSMVILFLGGAGLGQYPNIAYSELLSRISTRLNAAVIAAPYPLSLDHFDLSKKAGEALRRAVVQCEEKGNYSVTLPKFYLGHSLGSKLLGIALAASGIRDVDGVGLMSYNNFGFKNTISMVKDFADELNNEKGGGGGGMGGAGGMGGVDLDQILNFAGEAASMMGFEFSPDPETMDRIIQMKFDDKLQKKTRMFIFDDDDLDSSPGFLEACSGSGTGSGSGSGPSVSRLPGKHLSPVYIKLGLDDLDLPEQAMPFVNEASGGFQSASFGDEDTMNGAVDEICNWIMGQEPSRPPLLSGEAEREQ